MALVLGIETSCDETAVGIVDGRKLLANVISSSVEQHVRFGGVVPEVASRAHLEAMQQVIKQALKDAGVSIKDIDAIAVTAGPGLIGALLVGVSSASALSLALNKPLYGVNHLSAHIAVDQLDSDKKITPTIALLVSGGHSSILKVNNLAKDVQVMGTTIDDAAGEAFDKSAKLMGLPYPGGPGLSRLAEHGNPAAYKLPRPLLHSGDLDFSFAGLKTAVMVQFNKLGDAPTPQQRADLAASTQAAIVEVLVKKSLAAVKAVGANRLVVAGGVGANRSLRQTLNAACATRGVRVHYPELDLCTDNGAMIAMAAALRWQAGLFDLTQPPAYGFEVRPRWPLDAIDD